MHEMIDGSPTGYHFHSFFMRSDEVRNKYATYGHAQGEFAFKIPLWALSEDIQLGFDCAIGENSLVFDSTTAQAAVLYLFTMRMMMSGLRDTNIGRTS